MTNQTGITTEPLVVAFPGARSAGLAQVGGKGQSLLRLTHEGLAVPPGVILTTAFFASWTRHMLALPDWQALQDAPQEDYSTLCRSLTRAAQDLEMNSAQRRALATAVETHDDASSERLFAVRSSSTEEDLQGASFAGGYRTLLGVRADELERAVGQCYASLFSLSVLAYKSARGLSLSTPAMAVIIQQQLASEVAGVAFSLNPLNNDYDQVAVDANWGLGETVVDGSVSPDHWIIDKTGGRIISTSIGSKRRSRWQLSQGGVEQREAYRSDERCLNDEQLGQVIGLTRRVESLYRQPVDIEWAFVGQRLYILQARPITIWVPLPASLKTRIGEHRRLYMDVALSSGFTINAPISAMGLDVIRMVMAEMGERSFGPMTLGNDDGLLHFDGARMYLDMSNVLWFSSPKKMARQMAASDVAMSRLLTALDDGEYRSPKRPAWARFRMLLRLPGVIWRLRRALAGLMLPFFAPGRMRARINRRLIALEKKLGHTPDPSLPLPDFWRQAVSGNMEEMMQTTLPVVGTGVIAVELFKRIARPLVRPKEDLLDRIDRGFDGNVVVDISLAMSRLARTLPSDAPDSGEELAQHLKSGSLPEAFSTEWQSFVAAHGCRGPLEMDIAHPRFGDAPALALNQVLSMRAVEPGFDPESAAARQKKNRREAVSILLARAGTVRRRILRHLDRVIDGFAGLRDTPKQHFLMTLHGVRTRLLAEGARLCKSNRLDRPEQVFDLTFSELCAAHDDAGQDLRAVRQARLPFYEQLAATVRNFPQMIDSRGRIPRPPPSHLKAGEFQGVAMSAGRVTGTARVLRTPHEKPLARGDILIAYATDPGWTPLFANAAAVVLEVGGALQHGVVVAREFGLPCVVGIEGITEAIEDGSLIEVDADNGIVRLIEQTLSRGNADQTA